MSANIIIVEDEKDLATLLKYNLSKEGFKIKEAETGQEGLQLIKRELPDLVILDWMLPDFSGIEICRQIKRDNKLNDLGI